MPEQAEQAAHIDQADQAARSEPVPRGPKAEVAGFSRRAVLG